MFRFDIVRAFQLVALLRPKGFVKPTIRHTDTRQVRFSKGVCLTHGNMIAWVELFERFETMQYEEKSWENVYLAALPMFHVHELLLFTILSLGSWVVVIRSFDVEEAARAIDRYTATPFPVVLPILWAL